MGTPSNKPCNITTYTARTATEDIDCIAISPEYPDLMIYGTYSLVGKEQEYVGQIRKGSIEVLPVAFQFKPTFPGMMEPYLAKVSFPAAVLDIHFHPADRTLLGVALSNSEMHFFRFVKRGDILSRKIITEFLPLGHAKIADKDEYGLIPLVTQFTWFDDSVRVGRRDVNDEITVTLAAALSSNQISVVKFKIPGITNTHDYRLSRDPAPLSLIREDIHKHDLEAWTVSIIPMRSGPVDHRDYQLLSGADDSALIASKISLSTASQLDQLGSDVFRVQVWKDTKSHTAGVTAILPLPQHQIEHLDIAPLLTGSYDEFLRLFLYDTSTNDRKQITSTELRGGVWRLKLMDSYYISRETKPILEFHREMHYVVLASCMHAGAKIIRVTHDPAKSHEESQGWKIKVEAEFKKGHETLVYACDFRQEWEKPKILHFNEGRPVAAETINVDRFGKVAEPSNEQLMIREEKKSKIGLYTVISTSFYDRQICVWQWKDEKRVDAFWPL